MCEDVQELLSRKLDDDLTEEEEKILAEHLINCNACLKKLKAAEIIKIELNDMDAEPPVSFAAGTLYKAGLSTKKRRFSFGSFTVLAAAAALVVLAVTGTFGNLFQSDATSDATTMMDGSAVTVDSSAPASLRGVPTDLGQSNFAAPQNPANPTTGAESYGTALEQMTEPAAKEAPDKTDPPEASASESRSTAEVSQTPAAASQAPAAVQQAPATGRAPDPSSAPESIYAETGEDEILEAEGKTVPAPSGSAPGTQPMPLTSIQPALTSPASNAVGGAAADMPPDAASITEDRAAGGSSISAAPGVASDSPVSYLPEGKTFTAVAIIAGDVPEPVKSYRFETKGNFVFIYVPAKEMAEFLSARKDVQLLEGSFISGVATEGLVIIRK